MKQLVSKRRMVQAGFGGLIIAAIYGFHLSLWWILGIGALTGIVFGKVFCRWMCPMGFLMELLMGSNPESMQQQMYNYHKIGCPIAWVSGYLNRFSLFRIKRDPKTCIDCGLCDKQCYIASLNRDFSLYKKGKEDPSTQFSCSKCLVCVSKCPTKSLQYTTGKAS